MKKILSVLAAMAMMLGIFAVSASALDVAPKFSEAFFPEGSASAPEDVYYQIKTDDNGKATMVYLWLTQPDDVMAMFNEITVMDDTDKFIETYGAYVEAADIQIDCKLDDGEWQYVSDWDKNEYSQENQPYYMVLTNYFNASNDQKSYCVGTLMDAWYSADSELGFLAPAIVINGEDRYFDLENHSLTFRTRYLIRYTNENLSDEDRDANDGYSSYILSDWSEEVTIGKNATQVEPEKPEALETFTLSDLTFVNAEFYEDERVESEWSVYVDVPQQVGEAERYYTVKEDAFEPLCAVIEYRVQKDGVWGEWAESYWGNPTWMYSGWKSFSAEGVDQGDIIEFRSYIKNNMDDTKDSPYSNSVFCGSPIVSPDAIRGDCNNDRLVNMKDVLYLRKYLASIETTFPAHECCGEDHSLVRGDTNNDGAVNMKDVLTLRKLMAGLVDSLDPCYCQMTV